MVVFLCEYCADGVLLVLIKDDCAFWEFAASESEFVSTYFLLGTDASVVVAFSAREDDAPADVWHCSEAAELVVEMFECGLSVWR